jgi:hypothetical protein
MDDIKADSQAPVPPSTEEKPVEYSYEDLHKDSVQQIVENKEIPEEKKPEVKVDETKKEEMKDEVIEKEIEPEELAENIASKTAEKLKPKEIPSEPKKPEDEYKEFVDKVKEEKNRLPTYQEALEFVKDKVIVEIDKREAEKQEKFEQEKKEAQKVLDESKERFNQTLDEQIEDLYSQGKLTRIKDPNNPSDQGVLERKALFQTMLDVNEKRANEGKDPIFSLKEIFYEHYKKPNQQPAGSDAPVSMGQGTIPSGEGEEKELDYIKDVARPWSFFRKG